MLLCLISLSIGCSKDDYQLEQQQQRFPGSKVSFEQFKQETGLRDFKTSIQVKRKKNGALNRNADGSYELSDFDIDTDVIKRLEYKNDVTYTFRVMPKEPEYEKIFNLTMYNKDGNWETMIVELKPTEQDLEKMKLGQVDSFEGTVDLTYNSNKMCAFISILFLHCTKTGPCEKGPCDRCNECISSDSYTTCGVAEHELPVRLPSVLDSDGTGGGVGPGTDTGTTTTDTDQTLVVPPKKPVVIDPFLEYTPPPKTPCGVLKAKTAEPVLKNKLAQLNTQANFDKDRETGFVESRTTLNLISYEDASADPNTHKLSFPETIKMAGFAHVHNDKITVNGNEFLSVKMFSPKDIKAFTVNCQTAAASLGLTYDDTYGIMVSSEGTFAIKMLTPTVDVSNIDFKKFDDEYTYQAKILVKKDDLTSSSVQAMFLDLLKAKGIDNNIGLFKATNADLTEWSRVTKSNNGSLILTPCN